MSERISHRGFTLIELSIVLVVIGLIVGGILVGRDLIRAAELRSVIADIEKFKTAANTFNGKYDRLPGDCANATTFFGTTDSHGNTVHNGNGNGVLDDPYDNSNLCGPLTFSEPMWVWQELSLAGLIPGYYTGNGGLAGCGLTWAFWYAPSGLYVSTLGPNAPPSKPANGVYAILSLSAWTSSGSAYYPADYGNMIILGHTNAYPTGAEGPPYDPVLSPQDAYSIDSKIDDGIPSSGSVMTSDPNSAPNCNTWTNGNTAGIYNLSYQGPPVCNLMFLRVF